MLTHIKVLYFRMASPIDDIKIDIDIFIAKIINSSFKYCFKFFFFF